MVRYTVKRLLFFIPSVFFISLLSFLLIRSLPGDTVDFLIRSQTEERGGDESGEAFTQKYRQKARELGTDLPGFYISLGTLAEPRSLSYEWNPVRKGVIAALVSQTGNAAAAEAWYNSIEALDSHLQKFGKRADDKQLLIDAKRSADKLLYATDFADMTAGLQELREILAAETRYAAYVSVWLADAEKNLETLQTQTRTWKNYVPVIRFHARCAYGLWLFGNGKENRGVIRGDFGTSLLDKKPVGTSLAERIGLTVTLSLVSVLLSFLVSVPLGVFMALYRDTVWEKMLGTIVFIFYALPSFWVASLGIMWLAGGDGLDWFAPYGTGTVTDDMSFGEVLYLKWRHFALPVFAWTYGGIAFIAKQTQTAVSENMGRPYTLSAIARGLPFRQVLWGHVMPNSLRPLITIMANILPGLIGGSVVLETIFSLPGLGEWAYRAFLFRDFPVIMAVLFWGSLLTLTGYLISDLLLAFSDPRIRFRSAQK